VRASIVAAAKAQQSVHYKVTENDGPARVTIVGDVAAAEGTQHYSFKIGKKTGKVTIVVSGQTAYVQGNVLGLEALQKLTKAQATTYAGQWISIPEGDKDYANAATDVTLGSIIQSSTPRGRLAVGVHKLHGQRVLAVGGVTGTGKKREVKVLATRPKGSRLPIEEDEVAPAKEYISHTVFGRWNETVQAQVPASSVPIATVRG
jgi:hypothetical protein